MVGSSAKFIPSIKIGDFCAISSGANVYNSAPKGKVFIVFQRKYFRKNFLRNRMQYFSRKYKISYL